MNRCLSEAEGSGFKTRHSGIERTRSTERLPNYKSTCAAEMNGRTNSKIYPRKIINPGFSRGRKGSQRAQKLARRAQRTQSVSSELFFLRLPSQVFRLLNTRY